MKFCQSGGISPNLVTQQKDMVILERPKKPARKKTKPAQAFAHQPAMDTDNYVVPSIDVVNQGNCSLSIKLRLECFVIVE